ncbi:hypothetical protein [Curtobacterium sp. MCBD17_021]|uniref:hypothetical protein n=1 Tax=Curtobacterium sp. MCBD17_021 TaxID=2175665 RepID=UPI000DA7DF12|nr:hypothetical protein [Curtobacterium sp. MCBD17_021]PZE63612.1 hypothetical protein DEI83_13705 [Curtobacterium sp. MCBD17_021]
MTITWSPILVPTEHYADIALAVQHRLAELGFAGATGEVLSLEVVEGGTASASNDADAMLANHEPWEVSNLVLLLQNDTVTARRWVRAVDACAKEPDAFMSTEQIAEATGMRVNEWRSACRKMTVHQRATYPSETSWPLAVASGRDIGRPVGPLYVALTSEQSRRWSEAKAEVSGR